MRSARPLLLVLVLMLAGCASANQGAGLVRPQLPVLPGELANACGDPGVRAGQPVLNEFGRTRQALAECRRKHRDVVRFYDRLRSGLASIGE